MRDVTPSWGTFDDGDYGIDDGRFPPNRVWKQTDGKFTVVAEARSNHHSYRVRSGFRGHPQVTEPAATPALARTAARNQWRAYLSGELDNEPPPETVGALAERYERRTDLKARHVRVWTRQVRATLDRIGRELPLAHLSVHVVEEAFASAELAPGTHNLYLLRVRQLFDWALSQGWIDLDPTASTRKLENEHEMGPWLARSDWPTLLAGFGTKPSEERWRLRVEFLLHTGLRGSEFVTLTRSDLDLSGNVPNVKVREHPEFDFVPKSKRSFRSVPLDRRAVEIAQHVVEQWAATDRLFGIASREQIAPSLRAACKAAGFEYIKPHGCRRSAGAAWLEGGVNILLVSKWMGHSSVKITEQCYAGISDAFTAQGLQALNAAELAWQSGRVVSIRSR